ncbi:MAG: GNAT family N-acetyltransferase [Burkholderiales bacterium]
MSGPAFTVRFVDSSGAIDAALWEQCFPPPLEGLWWYQTLETSGLGDQFTFLYAIVEVDGCAAGISPAFLMRFPVSLVAPPELLPALRWLGRIAPSIAFPHTLFIGSPCADEGTVGLLPGTDRRRALQALQQAFQARARKAGAALMVWKDFPDSGVADFEWLANEAGLFRVTSFPGTEAELPPGGRDAYLAALKGSRRQQYTKKLRRSRAAADLATEVLHAPDVATLDDLFALFWQTYEKATTRFERLNREFFSRIAAQPVSHFVVLREKAEGRAVAFMLCFDLGERMINKFIGIDYARPKDWMLYFRLWDAAVDFAYSRGAQSIQSGQTGYAPKIETGHRLVPLANYCAHSNRMVHSIARRFSRDISWSTLDPALERFVAAHPEAEVAPPKGTPSRG